MHGQLELPHLQVQQWVNKKGLGGLCGWLSLHLQQIRCMFCNKLWIMELVKYKVVKLMHKTAFNLQNLITSRCPVLHRFIWIYGSSNLLMWTHLIPTNTSIILNIFSSSRSSIRTTLFISNLKVNLRTVQLVLFITLIYFMCLAFYCQYLC